MATLKSLLRFVTVAYFYGFLLQFCVYARQSTDFPHGQQKGSFDQQKVAATKPLQETTRLSNGNCVACPVAPPCVCQNATFFGTTQINCNLVANANGITEFPKISNSPSCCPVDIFNINAVASDKNNTLNLPSRMLTNLTSISRLQISINAASINAEDDAFAGFFGENVAIYIYIQSPMVTQEKYLTFYHLYCQSIAMSGIQLVDFSDVSHLETVVISEVEGQVILWPTNGNLITSLSLNLFDGYLRPNFSELHLTTLGITGFSNLPSRNNVAENLKNFNTQHIISMEISGFEDPSLANITFSILFPYLTSLTLKQNSIETLEPGCEISKLIHLQYLDLSSNDVTQLKSGTFDNMKNLSFLELQGNAVGIVEANSFTNLTALDVDYVGYSYTGSHVAYIGDDAFADIYRLYIVLDSHIAISIDVFREVNDVVSIIFTGNMTILPSKLVNPPRSTASVTLTCLDTLTQNCAIVCPILPDQFCAIFKNRQIYNLCPEVLNFCG